jgi:hypothetical protein
MRLMLPLELVIIGKATVGILLMAKPMHESKIVETGPPLGPDESKSKPAASLHKAQAWLGKELS